MNRLRQELNKPDQLQTKPALLRAFLLLPTAAAAQLKLT
jgi:hypothetical protein